MPTIHRYNSGAGYYIRSKLAEQILTFQLTRDGVTFLDTHGFGPGNTISGAMLAKLISAGYAFTGSSGTSGLIETNPVSVNTPVNPSHPLVLDRRNELQAKTTPLAKKRHNMGYQPNLWLIGDLHRRIVAAARQFSEYNVLLRPTRRHIFVRNFRLPDKLISEFFRPCFAILARASDPDKKPCLVIEIEEPGEEITSLYEQHGVLWVLIQQHQNRFVLRCKHTGTLLQVEETMGSLFKLLCAPLAWHERKVSFPQGSYVHSHSERILRDAVTTLSPSYRIELHHQVPLSYVIRFKEDLTLEDKKLLSSEIDAVITQSYEADPDGAVILPIRLDVHDAHRTNASVQQRDMAIKSLCERQGVPLLVAESNDAEGYEFKCETLRLPTGTAPTLDAQDWAGALAPFLGAAIRYAGRSF
jgi:hypothetical protein